MINKNFYKSINNGRRILMNNRNIKTVFSLFLMLIALFCVFSCSQTLPTQRAVVIERINSDSMDPDQLPSVEEINAHPSSYWMNADDNDSSARVTVFTGSKFARSVTERQFTVMSADGLYYLLYKFDGKTWSDSPRLNHPGDENGQKVFTGNVTAGEGDFKLYAYYTYEPHNVASVEISGEVDIVRFAPIPENDPKKLKVKLNFGKTFDKNTLQVGTELPSDWVFPRIEGLRYSVSSFDNDNIITIEITGTPTGKTTDTNNVVIPKKYVDGAELDLRGENQNRYTITNPTIDVVNQSIEGYRFTQISADDPKYLVFKITGGASFDDSVLIKGTSLKDYSDGFKLNYVSGLEYVISDVSGDELVVMVYGYPTEVKENTQILFTGFKEKYIKTGTSEDLITDTLSAEGSYYNIRDIKITSSADNGVITLVNGIQIPENASKVISLKISTGAKFKPSSVTLDSRVEWSTFTAVNGLKLKFGSLEEDGSVLNILLYGTPEFSVSGESAINISVPGAAIEGAPSYENIVVDTSSIKYSKGLVKLSVAKDEVNGEYLGTKDYPIQGVRNIKLGGGEGVKVRLILENATFNTNITSYLAECFSALQKTFGYTVEEGTYSVVAGGEADSGDVVVLIKGAPVNTVQTDLSNVVITLPSEVITSASSSLNNVSGTLYYSTSVSSLGIDDSGAYLGASKTSAIVATRALPIGSTDDKEEVLVKLNLDKAVFKEDITSSDIREWFSELHAQDGWGRDLVYSIVENKTDKDENGNILGSHIIIRINGTPTSLNSAPSSVNITVPRTAVKGSTASYTDFVLPLWYRVKGSVEAYVSGNGESAENPIKGTQYVMLSGGEGVYVDIALKGGKFEGVTVGEDVSSWFRNWMSDGIENASFKVVSTSVANDLVTVLIKGSINKATGIDNAFRVPVIIPRSKIKDASLSADLTAHLYYSTEARIGIELSSEVLYYGSKDSPLFGVRGISMNDGRGADIKILITNGGKFDKDIAVNTVETWFSSFGDLKSPVFGIVRGGKAGDDYIVIHIDGTLMSESGVQKSITLTLQKNLFNGVLINDLSTTLYYKSTSEVQAEVSTNAAYYGSQSNPLTGVRYMPLGAQNGEEIKIVLKNAKFVRTLKEGQSVKDWFVSFTDIAGLSSFTISEVAPDLSYVVIRIQGALSSPVKAQDDEPDTALISIPRLVIDGYLTENVITDLYYKATAEVSASVDSGSGYYGSLKYPIAYAQRVSLNNNEGVLVRINLENAVFNATLPKGSNVDLSSWFGSFNELINSSYTLEAGGEGENYAVIRIKGALITEAKQSKAINVKVPASALIGFLPSDLSTPLYYNITNAVTASFDLSGNYKGSSDKPIEGVSFVHLQNGDGVQVKINLDGGLFREDITSADVASWFSLFTDLSGKDVTIKDRGDYSYITFVLKGTLVSEYSDSVKNSSVRIPSSDIQNAAFSDDVVIDVYYRTIGVVSASVDETGEYVGAMSNPIKEVQNNHLGDAEGVFIKINLENGVFNRANKTSLQRGESVASWFTNFTDFSLATYTIEDIGDKYVVIRIKGSIISEPSTGIKSAYISIPSAAIYGSLESNVDTLMYYKTTGSIDVDLDARYAGTADNPISGVRYIELNNKDGVLVRVNLTGAKFARGVNASYDFALWFEELSALLVNETYTYHSGGEGEDFVIIKINGAFVSPTTYDYQTVVVRVPSEAIDAPSLTAEYLEKELYYDILSQPSADLDTGSDFYGTYSNPISDNKFVYLNNGNGLVIKIVLNNALFSSEVKKDGTENNLASWFTAFTNTIFTPDTTYTVEDGGEGKNFVTVRINGAVIASSADDKNISIPPSAIDGYLTDPISCPMYVNTLDNISLSLEQGEEYYGYYLNPLKGMQNVLVGNGEGELIRINLTKGTFASHIVPGYDISPWFTDISASMVNASFNIVSGGAGENYIIVRINGAFTTSPSTEAYHKAISIPAVDIAPYYNAGDSVQGDFSWLVVAEDEPQIASDSRYKGGSSASPISGVRYIALQDGEGEEVKIYLKQGSFNALSDEKVKLWFKNFDPLLTASSYRITEGGKDGDSFVVVKITGALTQSKVASASVRLEIPPEDVKNVSRTTPYMPVLFYSVTDSVEAEIESNINGYIGYENAPLTGYRYIPMNDGEGYLINIAVTNTVFESHIVQGFNVDSWFDDFEDITHRNYTVVEGGKGKNYVVIRVKGAIQTESTALKYAFVKIPANALVGYLPSFVPCPMYYRQEGTVSALFESTGYSGGENGSPVSGIQYAPIYTGSEEGVKVKILLNGAKFAATLTNDVAHWFNGFTDFIAAPYGDENKRSFEIIDGGRGKDYAVILIKGAVSTNKTAPLIQNVVIPFTDIDGYLDSGVTTKLYYQASGIITAEVENNSIYYGSLSHPVEGYQYMPLGGGSGLKVKIVLKNTVFANGVTSGTDVKAWFKNFNAFTSSGAEYVVESGGEGENYVIVTVKGSLSISDTGYTGVPSVEVLIPKNAVVASLPQDFTATLYYKSLGDVSASLDLGQDGKYYGSEQNPIEGVAFTDLISDRGSNIQMRIQLKGAQFKNVDSQTDVSSWFTEWLNTGDIKGVGTDPNPMFSVKAGGSGTDYVVIELIGKLVQTSTERRRVRVQIPKESITGELTSPVYATLVYKVSSSVKASIDMKGTYKGSYLYPITGSSALAFSNANRQIHVVLENAVFSQALNDNTIESWFKYTPDAQSLNVPSNVITTSGGGYKIISNGAGKSDVIIEITGGFKDTIGKVEKAYLDLRIPKEHIDSASLEEDVYLTLYYTCLGPVSLSLSSDSYFVGETNDYALEGIVGVGLNNGNGSYVRLLLANGVVFNSQVSSLGNPLNSSISDKITDINVSIAGGGEGASFLDLNIKGQPNTATADDYVQSGERTSVSVPLKYIEGCLDEYKNNTVTADLYYVFYADSALTLQLKSDDPLYYGSSAYPLDFIPYISFGEGKGVESRFDIVLSRSGRPVGKFVPVFAPDMSDVKIKAWFTNLFSGVLDNAQDSKFGAYSTSIVSGGPGEAYVVVRFTGHVTNPGVNKGPVQVFVKDSIAGGSLNLTLSTDMYIRSSAMPSVTLTPSSSTTVKDWFGTQTTPISGPLKSSLYKMNVRMVLSSGIKFSQNLTNDALAECIRSKLYAGYEVETGVVITRGGSGYEFVEFRIDSTTPLVSESVALTSADIVLPYTLISGAVNKPGEYSIKTDLWYKSEGNVSVQVYGTHPGSSKEKPLSIVNMVYLGEDEETGINTVFEITNAHLNQFSVGTELSWFENAVTAIDAELTFTVIPLQNVPGLDTTKFSVTTQKAAVGYTYNAANNTYNSYVGVKITGASSDLIPIGSMPFNISVPITDTNDARIKNDNVLKGNIYVERTNLYFSLSGVGATGDKSFMGAKGIWLGYDQNTGITLTINIHNGHFADTGIPSADFIKMLKEIIPGVYDVAYSSLNNAKTQLSIKVTGYPTSYTFAGSISSSLNTKLNMLVKYVKGGSKVFPNSTIYEMPMYVSVGIPQIEGGERGRVKSFTQMINPKNTPVSLYLSGNAKFKSLYEIKGKITIEQRAYTYKNSSGQTIPYNLYDYRGKPFTLSVDGRGDNTVTCSFSGGPGSGAYFDAGLSTGVYYIPLKFDTSILQGVVPGVTTLNLNNAYIVIDLLAPSSATVNIRFDSCTQRTPHGADYLMFAYVSITAPEFTNRGFGFVDAKIFTKKSGYSRPDDATFSFGGLLQYSEGRCTDGWSADVTRPRGDANGKITISNDRYFVDIVDVNTKSYNAKNKTFYLRLNPGYTPFNPTYGVGTYGGEATSNKEKLFDKDGNRSKSHYNKDNHALRTKAGHDEYNWEAR